MVQRELRRPAVELDRITSAYGRRTYNNENMLDSQGCFNISTMENKHSIVYRMDELSGERDSTSTKSCLMKGGPESKYIDFEAQTGKRRKWMNCDGGDKFC